MKSFEEVFGHKPYKIQEDFFQVVDKKGVYILEAPPGCGKTEAALYASYKLIYSKVNSGIYFAEPTQLTSNKILERCNIFLDSITNKKAKLAHSNAWLDKGIYGGEAGYGKSWFDPSKRTLLYPYGVGTVDQVLLSVLRVRHFYLRLFGLVGKVVILDEIHTYDMYTGTILNFLIESLKEIGCTIIVLSATLRKNKVQALINMEIPNAYPLISYKKNNSSNYIVSQYNVKKKVKLNFLNREEYITKIIDASKNNNVLVICNTVKNAQIIYDKVKHCCKETGLIHSRFILSDRNVKEVEWTNKLGKNTKRPSKSILIGTQILEQSLDIDADILFTEICPIDMLIQRIGRLWRHENERYINEPICNIITENLDLANEKKELKELVGKANSFVYDLYVLWKTFQTIKNIEHINVPDDIRPLIEKTYKALEDEPKFVKKLLKELEAKNKELCELALSKKHDTMAILEDDKVCTRYIKQDIRKCLILRNIVKYDDDLFQLTLYTGEKIEVGSNIKDIKITNMLHKNIVKMRYDTDLNLIKPKWLENYFKDKIYLAFLDDKNLKIDYKKTKWFYDSELGLREMKR